MNFFCIRGYDVNLRASLRNVSFVTLQNEMRIESFHVMRYYGDKKKLLVVVAARTTSLSVL